MTGKRLSKRRLTQAKRLLAVEALLLVLAFLPSRRSGTAHHDLFARWLIDEPGWIVSSLVNFAVLNAILAAILHLAMKFTAKGKR